LVPFRLEPKKRSGRPGRPTEPETVPRDLIVQAIVKRLMQDGKTQAEAIVGVASALGLGEETVKAALGKRYGGEEK
jgi:hypothetical protein